MLLRAPRSKHTVTLFPYTTLFRSEAPARRAAGRTAAGRDGLLHQPRAWRCAADQRRGAVLDRSQPGRETLPPAYRRPRRRSRPRARLPPRGGAPHRKSVVLGQSASVRVDLVRRRTIKKNKHIPHTRTTTTAHYYTTTN